MYESSPRSREVANALFQIDRLTEDQTRAILRHIAIEDAVLNEAQCSHVACVINGTLNKAPREGVNASLTCGTGLDAASHWEKSFASHPGHVSATFRKNSIDKEVEADQSAKQMVVFKPEKSAPVAANSVSNGTKLSVSGPPELQGLSIINQGQLTLHYHSYNAAPSVAPEQATVPLKRAFDPSEDEQYSEALASLMDFDLSPQARRNLLPNPKRQRMEELQEFENPKESGKPEEPELEIKEPEAQKSQKKIKQENEEPRQAPGKKKSLICKKCGNQFNPNQKKGSKRACKYHPGTFNVYPHGVKPNGKDGADQEPLYHAFSCCKLGPGSTGCTRGKHQEDDD